MPQPLSATEYVIIAVAGTIMIGNFVWSMTRPPKYRRSREKRKEPPSKPAPAINEGTLMWASYKAARRDGLSISDSIRDATDVVTVFQTTGQLPDPAQRRISAAERQRDRGKGERAIGVSHAILVNAVTALGVFQRHWPVGSALALYWSETVLGAILMFVLIAIWRRGRPATDRDAGTFEILGISLVFNAAHFVFLLLFLGVMLPRYAPAERFAWDSFERGLLLIGAILFVEFVLTGLTIRRQTTADIGLRTGSYMSRVGVLHLTIVFGMFALAIFGSARAFFAVFAGLKFLVDLSRGF